MIHKLRLTPYPKYVFATSGVLDQWLNQSIAAHSEAYKHARHVVTERAYRTSVRRRVSHPGSQPGIDPNVFGAGHNPNRKLDFDGERQEVSLCSPTVR